MALLEGIGAQVTAMSMERISLEDVFISFTGRHLREEGGGAAPRLDPMCLRRWEGKRGGRHEESWAIMRRDLIKLSKTPALIIDQYRDAGAVSC